jgi:hypothetical protein
MEMMLMLKASERIQTCVDGDGDAERMQAGVLMEMMLMLKGWKQAF